MIDVYCTDCGIQIDGEGHISNGGNGPLCPDCHEIAKLHEDAETEMKGSPDE